MVLSYENINLSPCPISIAMCDDALSLTTVMHISFNVVSVRYDFLYY